jgi:hypothetical protein
VRLLTEKYITYPQFLKKTTIKSRLLGYLAVITKMIGRDAVPERNLINKLENWSTANRQWFVEKFGDVSYFPGAITSTSKHKHYASMRYLSLAEEMGLITNELNVWKNTKTGEVLSSLKSNENQLFLSLEQICFLLKIIIEKDYDNLFILFDKYEKGTLDNISFSQYEESVREVLSEKRKKTYSISDVEKIRNEEQRLDKWEKNPEKYLKESIISPRLQWISDLKLLENEGSNKFKDFFKNQILNKNWNDDFYKLFYKNYINDGCIKSLGNYKDLKDSRKREIVIHLLEESYKLFGSKNIWRLNASQFLEYASCVILCDKIAIPSFSDLEETLKDISLSGKYNYKYNKTFKSEEIGIIIKY